MPCRAGVQRHRKPEEAGEGKEPKEALDAAEKLLKEVACASKLRSSPAREAGRENTGLAPAAGGRLLSPFSPVGLIEISPRKSNVPGEAARSIALSLSLCGVGDSRPESDMASIGDPSTSSPAMCTYVDARGCAGMRGDARGCAGMRGGVERHHVATAVKDHFETSGNCEHEDCRN